jgi:hypothetical protein
MNLVEAKTIFETPEDEQRSSDRLPSDRWKDFSHSELSHHDGSCCDIAREWIQSMDFAQLNGAQLSSGPRWLRSRYNWGPSSWPIHWCQVVERKTIDCGAHAALSRELFRARGMTAFPAQIVQEFDEHATTQWRGTWSREGVSCHWLDEFHIYHEATALLMDGAETKLWDASAASWIDARQSHAGYGSVTAIRVVVDGANSPIAKLHWGERVIWTNVWNQLG